MINKTVLKQVLASNQKNAHHAMAHIESITNLVLGL